MPKAKIAKQLKVTAAKPAVPSEAAKAFTEVEPELGKLAPEDLVQINVDIPRAVAIAIGALPQLAKLRADATKLPDFDVGHIDHLGTYALAAWYAHLLALPEVVSSALAPLLEEAKPLREDMLLAAELLAHKKYFDKKTVEAIRAGQGNLDVANDLVALAALFSAAWSEVEHRTTVEWDEVERASKLGPEILIAFGARDQPSTKVTDTLTAAERRVRAFTLFRRAYDQCRRAAAYLRWSHDDADEFAPALLPGRSGRGAGPRGDDANTPGAPVVEPPAKPEPAAGEPSTGV